MPDLSEPIRLSDPLIEAAVRPLADNPEVHLSAAAYLEMIRGGRPGGGSWMIRRWDETDARQKRPVWKLLLFGMLVMASIGVLISDLKGVLRLLKVSNEDLYSVATSEAENRIASRLDPAQRTLMFGDLALEDRLDRKKRLWESEPENPAFFLEYAVACGGAEKGLPDDFVANARRMDPDNAWFTYHAAAEQARACVERKSAPAKRLGGKMVPAGPPSWKILDEVRLGEALATLRAARGQNKCEHYYAAMMRRRLPLLSQSDVQEWDDSIQYLIANTSHPEFRIRNLVDAMAAKAWVLGDQGDRSGFRDLSLDAERFLRDICGTEGGVIIGELLVSSHASRIAASFGPAAEKLGFSEDAVRWARIGDGLRDWNQSRTSRDFQLDGKVYAHGVKTGILSGSQLEFTGKYAKHPPALNDADVKPLREMDHEIACRLCCYAAWVFMGLVIGILAAFRYRAPWMVRRLAGRMESLLTPVDWVWVVALGLIPPLLYVLAINRFTPFGGREFGLLGTFLLLPAAQFAGLLLLWLLLPATVIRWRMGRRAGVFGLGVGRRWLAALPVVSAMAFVPVVGWAGATGSIPAFWVETFDWHAPHLDGRASESRLWVAAAFFAVPFLWVLIGACCALCRDSVLLRTCVVARVLSPVHAAAMILLLVLTPLFKFAEHQWFTRDTLCKFDGKTSGWSRYETGIALQMRKELREILEYRD